VYRLKIKERAEKDLTKLAPVFRNKIAAMIRELADNSRLKGSVKLTDREVWRICQGDY